MKRGFLAAAIFLVIAIWTTEDGLAASRLLKVRKWSDSQYTRVVLDLENPPAYEIQSAAQSPLLTIRLPKLDLPQGTQEVLVEDQVIRKVKLDPVDKDGVRVTVFLYRPTRWKVFALKASADKPDRLVIDVFKPAIEEKEREEKPITPVPGGEKAPPVKREEPPRVISPEQLHEKETAASPKAASRLLDIRQWSAPDHSRVVVDLDGPPHYELLPLTDPLIHTLNLRGVVLSKGRQEISVADQVIQKITCEPVGREDAKLTFFLVKPGQLDVFLLKPYLDKPDRLVIDVYRPDLEEKEKVERQVTRELKAKKKRIVVLDPGHGGEDPGAIGPRGTMEKNIVLAVALSLQKVLDATGEVRAFLTRRGDYFVSLHDRVRIAQEYGADLFISLHANGSRSRQTRGTSIFSLSLKGASDTATQLLAQKENASDMVGGISLASPQRDLDSILLDLVQTHSINESLHLGGLVLSELGRVNPIQFSRPRQAGFAVLKAPEFPSILVETAYITHPAEEILLRKKNFQDKLCQAITAAVKKFIPVLAVKEEKPSADQPSPPPKERGV